MKRRNVYLLAILSSVMLLLPQHLYAQASAPALPKITFDEEIHDFGRQRSGEVLTHEFQISNKGTAELLIHGIQPSCGCTTVPDFPPKLAPGEKAGIKLQINTHGLIGEQIRTLLIKTNDPTRPDYVLQIKGNYWMPIEITPTVAMMFLPPNTDQKLSTSVRIVSNLGKPIKLEPPVSNVPQLTARLVEQVPGKEFQVVVDTLPPFAHNDIQATITLATNSPENPSVNINVVVIAQPEIVISPPQMFLPTELPTTPQPYTISIKNQSRDALALTNLACDAPGSKVELRQVMPGKDLEIIVHFSPEMAKTPEKTYTISCQTNSTKLPQISIPVQIVRPPIIRPQAQPLPNAP